MTIELRDLQDAARSAAAIRAITRLEPAGGPGDKVFPPTYTKEGRAETKYAFESRWVDGREVKTVLLDSVASQANRMEEALLAGWRNEELRLPVVLVDFSQEEGLQDLDELTSLDAPHRIADAILRDSLLEGTLFRLTDVGRAFTDARPEDATAMLRYCPTALVFGVWDSTGPKGGLGSKFQRCLVSEIVGFDAVAGVKTASRLDPAGIQKKTGTINVYHHADPAQEWTLDEAQAARDGKGSKAKPALFARRGEGKGTPAAINHGNVAPSLDREAGGVTISHAKQTTVLSLAGLRRLRFRAKVDGTPIPRKDRAAAENAAHTALAALAIAAIVYQRAEGYDLRSRSLLVPTDPFELELLGRDAGTTTRLTLEKAEAAELLDSATELAREHGLGWEVNPIRLQPAPKLCQLIRASRELQRVGEVEES